ncbi:unnamed protein product [Medioppia subpectinata]|uniref:Uncharacterized protein n=1 Tax=Medioppia subpectinata TaxID=1979941 RepID=A0A7R9KF44_9ACAR|nr:unnamed protein product [Medioppia subpectinata]CAG2102030.1 unnamed protein product [Medioppia subpectinata]
MTTTLASLVSSYPFIQYSCLSFVTIIVTFRVYCQHFVWTKCSTKTSLKGKTVVITGANSGVGKETARQLVRRGARVVMGCRDGGAAHELIQQLTAELKPSKPDVVYKNVDLCSFASVKEFAEDLIRTEPSVDVLINNAAVFGPPFGLTVDGFETQFQTNHLSAALLTILLSPKLNTSSQSDADKSRVLMITSTLYRKGVINDNDFQKGYASVDNYESRKAYNNSKLANLLFARRLHSHIVSQNQMIDVLMASPGIVWTNLSRHMRLKWWQLILLSPFAVMFVRTPKQGSETPVHCATAQPLISDTLYRNCCPQKWDAIASDPQLCDKVYEMTIKAIETYI